MAVVIFGARDQKVLIKNRIKMKKLVIIAFVFASMCFASCGNTNASKPVEQDSITVVVDSADSVQVDSVVIDSLN